MKRPNLFNFATSELSQDAFLCWLAEWANCSLDTNLQNTAKEFLCTLIGREIEINNVRVIRQWEKIDILLIVNEEIVILIEDKTNTSHHSNQLERYKEAIEKQYPHLEKCYIYLKTGNYSLHTIPNKDLGYKLINRKDILNIIKYCKSENFILKDFTERLQEIEEKTNSYFKEPISAWSNYAWEGLYTYIQSALGKDYTWSYVSNAQGGFIGLWGLQGYKVGNGDIYLQIQQDNVVIKVNAEIEIDIKDICNCVEEVAKAMALPINRPSKPANKGKTRTVGIVYRDDFYGKEILTEEKIKTQIEKYSELVCKTGALLVERYKK